MADPIVVRLTHSSYETLGSNSLMGFYAQKLHASGYKGGDDEKAPDLILEIEQTDYAYRRANNGPSILLMPEFVPYLMMQDIQSFQEQGIKVTIKVVEVSQPS